MTSFKINAGIDYTDKRAEAGDVVSDLPSSSIAWLVEQGIVEEVEFEKPLSKSEPKSPNLGDDE